MKDKYHYLRSLGKPSFIKWDSLILTASNDEQAAGCQEQIQQRLMRHQLPIQTQCIVLSDSDNK